MTVTAIAAAPAAAPAAREAARTRHVEYGAGPPGNLTARERRSQRMNRSAAV